VDRDALDDDRDLEVDLNGTGRVPLYWVPPRVAYGWFLVHNTGRPQDPLDLFGTRVWLQERITPAVIECHCGWLPRLGIHYRFDIAAAVEHYRSLGFIG
jgi:hypothetical protein